MDVSSTPLTHPETAWIAVSVPLWLLLGGILGVSLTLRGWGLSACRRLIERRRATAGDEDPALLWSPPVTTRCCWDCKGWTTDARRCTS